MFHSSSIISKKAIIHKSCKIGPFTIIDENVEMGEGNIIHSNVHITGNTKIGKNNIFFPFSSIGAAPQDMKYQGETSVLSIGNNNIFREQVSINPGTLSGGMITKIHDNCLIMIGSHIAHDCIINSNVILVNNATLGGHVTVGENAIIGGNSGIHQFVNIGKHAMIGGMSGVDSNIIPYGLYVGVRENLRGLNLIGLKRKKIESIKINNINRIFKKIFCKNNNIIDNINKLPESESKIKEISEIITYIKLNLKRGICKYIDE